MFLILTLSRSIFLRTVTTISSSSYCACYSDLVSVSCVYWVDGGVFPPYYQIWSHLLCSVTISELCSVVYPLLCHDPTSLTIARYNWPVSLLSAQLHQPPACTSPHSWSTSNGSFLCNLDNRDGSVHQVVSSRTDIIRLVENLEYIILYLIFFF